jgi:LacI family transcriptional regulator
MADRGEGKRRNSAVSDYNGRRSAVTIYDVAKAAGVSAMTVSRVINDHQYVSDTTREKVWAAVAELNFSPNLAARAARSGMVRIGALYSNPTSSNLGQFLMGAFRQSAEVGCQLLIEPSPPEVDPVEAVKRLADAGVDGVILPPPLCDSEAVLDRVDETGLIALSFASATPSKRTSAVRIDDFNGARAMTKYLIDLGHEDIAIILGDPQHSPAQHREAGYRAAMAEAGLKVGVGRLLQGYFTYRSGLEAAQRLLDAGDLPTAMFACNDDMAAGALAAAHGVGIKVPGQLSVAGFDDTPVATTVWPELTTVHQPIAEMAARSVDILADQVRRIRSGETPEPVQEIAACEIVARGSTAPPAPER